MMEGLKKYEKIIRWAIIVIIAVLLTSTTVSTVKSYQLGRLCNQFRERIADTEDTNRRLAETIERSQSICDELECSVDRNITTARAAVELIEEIRVQVQSLEMELGGFDWDSYYNSLDADCGL